MILGNGRNFYKSTFKVKTMQMCWKLSMLYTFLLSVMSGLLSRIKIKYIRCMCIFHQNLTLSITESQNRLCWKRPPRSSSPTSDLTLTSPQSPQVLKSLPYVKKCIQYSIYLAVLDPALWTGFQFSQTLKTVFGPFGTSELCQVLRLSISLLTWI